VQIRAVDAGLPGSPSAVTSITKDAGATVSFRVPVSDGGFSITHYVVTPYIGATAQATTTVAVASLGSITGSNTLTYKQATVTGLTNSTAYTFTVKARNTNGDGPESVASGANTPLSGLVFGDDFNGSAGGDIDPEWWIYDRCGFIAQSEVQWYKPDMVVLDGSGNLKITAQHTSVTGTSYPSDGNTTRTQTWRSGACQSNTKTWGPSAGNTMTYQARFQLNANAGNGFWPGFFWLNGQFALNAWKTDPGPNTWDDTTHAEIDVAEWNQTGGPNNYLQNTTVSGTFETDNITGSGLATSMHTFEARWKPGVSTKFYLDGVQKGLTHTGQVPASGAQFVLLLYMQMLSGGPTGTESIFTDWVRVFDQNLG
jgi:hypothetical protein